MNIDLILSQGRIADRKDGTIEGALLTAQAIEKQLGTKALVIGNPSPALNDDWTESLPAAKDTLDGLQQAVRASLKAGNLPIMVANTCSASLATLPVVAAELPDACVLWIDAHGDFNVPDSTDSGYLGGMVVAAACGLWDSGMGAGLRSDLVTVVGGRDIDAEEQKLLDANGVKVLRPESYSLEALSAIVGDRPVWVHIDWDVLEPGDIPADYAVTGGLLPKQVEAILAELAPQIRGLEIAEFHVADAQFDPSHALKCIVETVRPALQQNVFA